MRAPFFAAYQPPLYYASLAPLVTALGFANPGAYHAFVDPLELPVSAEGPFSEQRGARLFVHVGDEAFPYRGEVLLIHALRFASLPLGIAVVLITYALAMRLVPTDRSVAILAAGFVALIPYFGVLSGAVTNDNLANVVGALLILATAEVSLGSDGRSWPALKIGLLCGIALITKHTLVPLTLCATGSLLINARPRRGIGRSLVPWALGVAIPSGWYVARNLLLYGEPLMWRVRREHLARLGHVTTSPDRDLGEWLQYLLAFAKQLHDSFWGNMGILNRPLPPLVYAAYDSVVVLALVGGGMAVLGWRSRCWPAHAKASLALAAIILLHLGAILYRDQALAAQGRYFYVLLPAIGFFVATGFLQCFRPERRLRATAIVLTAMVLAGTWVLAVFLPRLYRPPQSVPSVMAPLKTTEPRFPGLPGFARHAQRFVASRDLLSGIDVRLGTYAGRAVVSPILRLSTADETGEVAVVSLPAREIVDNAYARFAFTPIAESAGKKYTFEILLGSEAVGIGPAIWGTYVRPPEARQRHVNGRAVVGFVDFRAVYGSAR